MEKIVARAQAAWKPSTYNNKERSVRAVVATEAPVNVFDFERFEVVPEILLMAGMSPIRSDQVPLLDSHSRVSVSDVLGSARNFQVNGSALESDVFFSSDDAGQHTAAKVRDGHLTDFSIGYAVSESHWIDAGEAKEIAGRNFEGPLRVVTKWEIRELSITPIAADKNAKARSEKTGELEMSKAEQDKIRAEERGRVAEITAMGSHFGCAELARAMVDRGATVDEAREAIMNHMTRINPDPVMSYRAPAGDSLSIIADEGDKRSEAMVDGLVMRSGLRTEKPAQGAEDFQGASLVDIARECLSFSGRRVSRGMSRNEIVRDALSVRSAGVTDFPYVLANTANKVLRKSYEQIPSSFERWVNITSGSDFKEMSRNQLSEAPDLDQVPELTPYSYGQFGESKEVFSIYKYGKLFAVSREAIINDDLSAFTRIPRAFSMSAKRLVNASVYGVLTTNAAMSDGVALFNTATHKNLASSGATIGIDSLDAGRVAMRTQTGLKGATLNIAPKFLIVPAELETDADQILNTIQGYDASSGQGVTNPFYKRLEPVVDSVLDADSSSAWYLAADPNQVDTVELCFLDGQRRPYLETKDGWSVDGVEYKCRIEFGVKAIDWRGLYKNPGV